MFGATRFSQAASAVSVKCSHMAKSSAPVSGVPKCEVKTPSGAWRVRRESRISAGFLMPSPEIESVRRRARRCSRRPARRILPRRGARGSPPTLSTSSEAKASQARRASLTRSSGAAERGPRTEVPPPKSQDLPLASSRTRTVSTSAQPRSGASKGILTRTIAGTPGERSRPQVWTIAAALPGPMRNPAFDPAARPSPRSPPEAPRTPIVPCQR